MLFNHCVICLLLLSGLPVPRILPKLSVTIQNVSPGSIPELDPATADWVCLIPVEVLEEPFWPRLRVLLAQTNRAFLMFGSSRRSALVVEAMRDGAFDFLFHDEPGARWKDALEKAAESQALWLRLYGGTSPRAGLLIGRSAAMASLTQVIQRIGPTAASVMITGESGTGKEKVARALHEASGLRGPFLAVNCAAIPRDLIEAELFGAEKGAFTGAGVARPGLVELAPQGTLFLDEIGELDVSLQPKLLRFLETRRARRIGGKGEYAVEVRVLAATNRNLEDAIEHHLFRLDLYYRLAEVVLKLPSLRHHLDDVPLLAGHFLQEANEKFGKNILSLEPGLVARLMEYSWPGNVRELRSAIHRLVILYNGPVLRQEWWSPPEMVSPEISAGANQGVPIARETVPISAGPLNRRQKWEKARQLLEQSGHDQSWTAAQLGIHPTTLFRWIKSGRI
jgi:DNA-binding NtrC family response regulator